MEYSADTDSWVARHNGATYFMVLLNLKGDKMTFSINETKEHGVDGDIFLIRLTKKY